MGFCDLLKSALILIMFIGVLDILLVCSRLQQYYLVFNWRRAILRQKAKEELIHVTAYMPKELFKKLEAKAEKDRRSLSSEVVVLLEKLLHDEGAKP